MGVVGEALASVGVLPNDVVLGYGSAMKKMARAMAALQVAKIVVKGTETEARCCTGCWRCLEDKRYH